MRTREEIEAFQRVCDMKRLGKMTECPTKGYCPECTWPGALKWMLDKIGTKCLSDKYYVCEYGECYSGPKEERHCDATCKRHADHFDGATKRPDFDWTCECGYLICDVCGTPYYPMEVEEDGELCQECGQGTIRPTHEEVESV